MTDTPKPKRRGAVTRGEIDALEKKLAALEAQQEDTHAMVKELHDALVHPQPGHDKSLIDRMALTTIYLESAGRVRVLVVWIAGLIAAISAIYGAFRLGVPSP